MNKNLKLIKKLNELKNNIERLIYMDGYNQGLKDAIDLLKSEKW